MVNPTKTASKIIYTTHDVSRLLHVNPRSVINWIEQSLLPSYRTPGGHRRIKADSSNKTAIIAISGTAEKEKKVLAGGADAFMLKPIDLDKLHTEARRLLRVL